MKTLIIFPTQLFETKYLPEGFQPYDTEIIIWEHPVFFGFRRNKLILNKLKLVLHRASCKWYADYLSDKKYKVKYINYSQKFNYPAGSIFCFDPTDHLISEKLQKNKVQILPTPNFLTPRKQLEEYAAQRRNKKFIHSSFYNWQKQRMGILTREKSYDSENRNKVPDDVEIPQPPKSIDNKYIKAAKIYVNNNFPDNYGDTDNFWIPITHADSKKWFQDFLKNKFDSFGTYQDAIVKDEPFLFHSGISAMLNIGLLSPEYVVKEATAAYNKKKISINNYEGFIRQIIGWREYSRLLYLFKYEPIVSTNYFGNSRKLSSKWYSGATGIEPVDDAIHTAFKWGYLHHIERLMVMSNFMNLCGIDPDEAYKWFMEFSVDSYDWVMTNNVYCMGMFADGGLTMTRPYLSSSNYIKKMSDYSGDWAETWDNLYYYFLYKHDKKLRSTQMARNLNIWKNKSKSEQQKIIKFTESFLKKI